MAVNIDAFELQIECSYKNEHYSVRDNGAVKRHSRESQHFRKLDNHWTFGTANNNGYMLIGSEVVHRIVACAFLGEPPTPQHIVDHIDTNRQNNRPRNLRWLTKLENILNNPITVKKIEFLCGTLEVFLKNPSVLKNYLSSDPNFSWMRTVTEEEARTSWERLSNWAKTEYTHFTFDVSSPNEWMFSQRRKTEKERIRDERFNSAKVSEMVETVLQKVERETGLSRMQFSSKSKRSEHLKARVYAAKQLRLELDLSEEGISKIIGISKSMVNTYLNHTDSFLNRSSIYRSNTEST